MKNIGFLGLAFISAFSLTGDIWWTSIVYAQCDQQYISIERVAKFLDLEPEFKNQGHRRPEELNDKRNETHLEFKNVKLHYKEGDKAALDGVSLSIARNEKVGICGRTGSGKSSILSLLFLAYKPQEGSIRVGGSDIQEYGSAIRGFVSIIPQEIVIFEGTVKENLDMRNRFTTE